MDRKSLEKALELFKDKPVICAEIGLAEGNNALSIITNLNISKIYLIDNYRQYPERRDEALQKLEAYKDKYIFINENSYDAAEVIDDYELDYLYIDGDHTFNGVTQDLNNYIKKVNRGGIISGHDYNNTTVPGVKEAVDHFFKFKCKTVNIDAKSSDWWVYL